MTTMMCTVLTLRGNPLCDATEIMVEIKVVPGQMASKASIDSHRIYI